MAPERVEGGATSDAPVSPAGTYRKVTRRLLPFLFACYVAAYLDRVNVGFAKLQMQADLAFSDTVYGLAAGIFFVGYFLFEVPSNVLLHRLGARVWIARIMVSWGLVSALTLAVRSPTAFYVVRFLLGVAEAGFFPGVVLYFTYWYPARYRARVVALLFTAVSVSGIVGGPASGAILKGLAGAHGWAGWQWLFLLEAVPSIALGLWALHHLDDRIADARWLTAGEKAILERGLAAERTPEGATRAAHAVGEALGEPRVWILGAIYFCLVSGVYAISFWLPQIVRNTGVKDLLAVGALSAVPWAGGAIAMVVWGRRSDATGERRWHVAIASFVGAGALVASTWFVRDTALSLLSLTVATAGILSTLPVFWTVPTSLLAGTATAVAIAWVNSIGNLGGFAAPYLVGWLNDRTGSSAPALYVLAALLALGGVLLLLVARPRPTVDTHDGIGHRRPARA